MDELDNVVGTLGEVELEPAPGALPPLPIPEFPVAGEIINLDTTALFISGLSSISIWMVPALAVAGTGAYLTLRKR